MNQETGTQQAQLESQVSLGIIRGLIKAHGDLKLVEAEAKTGFSYFAGKKRLCKLLNTKKGVTLEINVALPKNLADLPEMQSISPAVAHAKHLGTMKHLYRAGDSKAIKNIITEALKVFKAEIEAEAAQEKLENSKEATA